MHTESLISNTQFIKNTPISEYINSLEINPSNHAIDRLNDSRCNNWSKRFVYSEYRDDTKRLDIY